MQVDIITIGDEILIGQTIDTNSAWLGHKMNELGFSIRQITSISDNKNAIESTVENSLKHADLVFVTGGLGPTKDDITKSVLTEYFQDELVLYPHIADEIEAYFTSVGKPFLEVNKQQAMLPKKAIIIRNDAGTASGMWFKKEEKHLISMPGVPYEMKGIIERIIPHLKDEFNLGDFYHKTIQLQGIGESSLADQISDIEKQLESEHISIAYLPSIGIVKIRLTGTAQQADLIADHLETIKQRFPANYFGADDLSLQAALGELLKDRKMTIGTVESCTGGAIAQRIVSTAGSSAYYEGSIVSYSYDLKEQLVAVNHDDLWNHGAVSQTVVEQMAQGGLKQLGVDICISTSGIAGPDGGTEDKPVGTVWVGIATKDRVYSKKFQFKHNRERNIESTVVYGLNFVRRVILGFEDEKTN